MKRGSLDDRAGEITRLEDGDRSGGAGATDGNHNVENFRGDFLCRKFKSDGSTRSFADNAKLVIDFTVVNLDHHAVGVEFQSLTIVAQALNFGKNFL